MGARGRDVGGDRQHVQGRRRDREPVDPAVPRSGDGRTGASWRRAAAPRSRRGSGAGSGVVGRPTRPDGRGTADGLLRQARKGGEPVDDEPGHRAHRVHAKKKSLVATERDRKSTLEKRAHFIEEIRKVDPARLVFIDESGSHISMTREYARAPIGHRVFGRVPRNRGRVLTMIGALGITGMRALMTVEGGTSGKVFLQFVREYLIPSLRRGDVVVMDNLGAHHATGVRQEIEAAEASVLYMPPYSPDLNPIELCWSKMKYLLKSFGARTVRQLIASIGIIRGLVTRKDAAGWYAHCGWTAQLK